MSEILPLLTEIADRASKELGQDITNQNNMKDYLFTAFNLVYKNFNVSHKWPWRDKTFTLQTVPNYTAGSVIVTTGSRTVINPTSSWTSAMAGRFLKLDRDNEVYEILSVESGISLTLSAPYAGASGSSLAYLIWKRFYECPPDMLMATDLEIWQLPRQSQACRWKEFSNAFNNPYLKGTPLFWSWYGVSQKTTTYSTGTVTATQDSRVLTFVGASLLDNVLPGSKITIGSNVYNADTIDSDTQITMVQKATSTASASVFSIERRLSPLLSLSSVPEVAANLYLTYPKRVYNLVNDKDEPTIYEEYELNLMNVVYAYLLEKLNDKKGTEWLKAAEYQKELVLKGLSMNSPIEQATRVRTTRQSGYRSALYG